ARELRLSLGEPAARLSWAQAMRVAEFPDAVERVHGALAALNSPLQEQAERSEGLGVRAPLDRSARCPRAPARGGGPGGRALGRSVRPVGAAQYHAALVRRALRPADERPPARLDLHL